MQIHAEKYMIYSKSNPEPPRINFAFESGNKKR